MSERVEFEMSEDQHRRLLAACAPVPYMVFDGVEPRTPQQNANDAWRALGRELGFDWESAKPVPGKDSRHFTALELPEWMKPTP